MSKGETTARGDREGGGEEGRYLRNHDNATNLLDLVIIGGGDPVDVSCQKGGREGRGGTKTTELIEG